MQGACWQPIQAVGQACVNAFGINFLSTAHVDCQACLGSFTTRLADSLLQHTKLQTTSQVFMCNARVTKTSPQCRNPFYCPQTFLSLDFQCRDSVSELKSMLRESKEHELSALQHLNHVLTCSALCAGMTRQLGSCTGS